MNYRMLIIPIFGIMTCFSITAFAQINFNFLQITHPAITKNHVHTDHWFVIMELPLMIFSVFFAFATAAKMKHAQFQRGMKLIAWGFLVMAIGHAHMQFEHFTGINLFETVLGETGGHIAWVIGLLSTWGLSALGLYTIFKCAEANQQ